MRCMSINYVYICMHTCTTLTCMQLYVELVSKAIYVIPACYNPRGQSHTVVPVWKKTVK